MQSIPGGAKPTPPAKVVLVDADSSAVSVRGRFVWYAFLALAGCTLDLATKQWMFAWRGLPRESNEWWLIPGYVGIETAVNHGALFGMGQGFWPVFVTLSFIAAIGIVLWLFRFGLYRDFTVTTALGLITGGIFGNLYDRLGLWTSATPWAHGVRDWILFRYSSHTWPNFNLADSFLVCGAAWLVWHSFWQPPDPAEQPTPEKPKTKSK